MRNASLFFYIKLFLINSLEVVVNSESNVVAIKACTPSVSIYAWTLLLNRLPTSETYVSYEAYLWANVYSNTWLQTYRPCVCTTSIVLVSKTTINETIYILATCESVTNVWLQLEVVVNWILALDVNRVTFTPTNYGSVEKRWGNFLN